MLAPTGTETEETAEAAEEAAAAEEGEQELTQAATHGGAPAAGIVVARTAASSLPATLAPLRVGKHRA